MEPIYGQREKKINEETIQRLMDRINSNRCWNVGGQFQNKPSTHSNRI